MKLLPFLTLTGILSFIAYGISRTIYASRLIYLIQNAQIQGDQLGMLVSISNPDDVSFTQQSITADVLLNGKKVTSISNDQTLNIPGNQITPQGWVLDLPAGTDPNIQVVQLKGSVQIGTRNTPLDLKYKLI